MLKKLNSQKIFSLLFFIVMIVLTLPSNALASKNQSYAWLHELRTLDYAFDQASRISGVPQLVLMSIGYVESGIRISKKLQSWPWAVHAQGQGYYFARKKDALAFIRRRIQQGISNIDLGCMQLSWRWHQKSFKNVKEMLDPHQNIPRLSGCHLIQLVHFSWQFRLHKPLDKLSRP